MIKSNLDSLLNKIRPFLKEYLESKGIAVNRKGFFRCINPKHNDSNPSCSLGGRFGSGNIFHCFGCGKSGDIFTAANILDEMPIFGIEFIKENVFKLAEKFAIDYSNIEISEQDLTRSEFYTITKRVAEYVLDSPISKDAETFLESRGLSRKSYRDLDIGFVDDFSILTSKVTEDKQNILDIFKNCGLYDRRLFNPTNIIFVIRDSKDRPVGFAARNLLYDSKDSNSVKFWNQISNSTYDIYKKGKRLYGLSKTIVDDSPLYIFEGYLDRAVGTNIGVKCCAIGGIAFTKDHLDSISKFGHKNVVLVFDGDERGKEATFKLIDSLLEEPQNLDIKLAFIPDGLDPDELMLTKGAKGLYDIPKLTPFEWRLNSLLNKEESFSPESICNIMVPYVSLAPTHLQRLELAKILARTTGVDLSDIRIQLETHINSKSALANNEVTQLLNKSYKEALRHPENAITTLSIVASQIEEIQNTKISDAIDINEFGLFIDSVQKQDDEASPDKIPGYSYGSFKKLTDALAGNMSGKVLLLAGSPNTGKTALFSNLALQLANENEDIVSFIHTVDDTRLDINYRLLAIIAAGKYPKISINKIKYYKYFVKKYGEKDIIDARSYAYQYLKMLVNNQRLFMKDIQHGGTAAYTSTMIKRLQDKVGKNVAVFIDNIHNLNDFSYLNDKRDKYKQLAAYVKQITKLTGCTIFGTVQYTKGSIKAFEQGLSGNLNDLISETVAFEYDADAVLHLYNELHFNNNTDRYHTADWSPSEKYPLVESVMTKNKISEFKGSILFKFFPYNAVFEELE